MSKLALWGNHMPPSLPPFPFPCSDFIPVICIGMQTHFFKKKSQHVHFQKLQSPPSFSTQRSDAALEKFHCRHLWKFLLPPQYLECFNGSTLRRLEMYLFRVPDAPTKQLLDHYSSLATGIMPLFPGARDGDLLLPVLHFSKILPPFLLPPGKFGI